MTGQAVRLPCMVVEIYLRFYFGPCRPKSTSTLVPLLTVTTTLLLGTTVNPESRWTQYLPAGNAEEVKVLVAVIVSTGEPEQDVPG